MKCRSVYGLTIVTLILSFWLPGLINVRGDMVFAQAVSSPPKPLSTAPAQAERGGDAANMPPTDSKIDWSLVGTVVMDDPSESFAIMEYKPTGGQGTFKEGDRLGEIRIKKILPDGIVIKTDRGEETLSVSAGGTEGGPTPPEPQPQRRELRDRTKVDSRYRDYGQFMSEIRVSPQFEGGQPSGLLIYYVKPDSIFSQNGLKNGDLIVAVNGKPIPSRQEVIVFYEALKAGGQISLKIKRGENLQDFRFEIQ